MNLVALLLGETAGMAAGLAAARIDRRPARPRPRRPADPGQKDRSYQPAHRASQTRPRRLQVGGAGWLTGPTWQVTTPLALVAGVLAALAPGAPTGWTPLDVALKALLGAGITLAGADASPRLSVVVSVVALVVATGSPLQWLAAVACGLSLALLLTRTRLPPVSALGGAMVVQVALRLSRPTISLVTAVEGAVVLVPLVVVGLR